MIRLTNRKILEAAACSGLLLLAACGDDDGPRPDAALADSGPEADAADEADAAPAAPSGLIALTEVTLTNPEAAALGLSGASVGIGWVDPATVTVPPVEGFENNVGGCRITVYDVAAGDEPGTEVDAGNVTITGTASDEFACVFSGAAGYVCQSTDEAAAGEAAVGATAQPPLTPGGPVTYTFPGVDFSGANYVGMHLQVDGFTDEAANGTFPIVGFDPNEPSQLQVASLSPPALATAVEDTPGSYLTVVGAGPVPGGFDFLDGASTVSISKPEAGRVAAIDVDIVPNGEGFALAEASAEPHAIPTDGSEVVFLCPGTDPDALTGGDCGTTAGGPLQGMTLSGSTTDASVEGLGFNAMPPAESQYATFQCSAIGQTGAALSAEAMAVILGTSPTRIQVNVSYMAAAIEGTTNVVAGHTLAGFTDVAQ